MLTLLALFACDDPSSTPGDSEPEVQDSQPRDSEPPPVDEDGDGYSVEEDCDDADPAVNPGATEACNLVDDDCDGQVDFEGWIPGDYDSLYSAAAHAPDGAHLCLEEGEFEAWQVSLDRSLHLHGSGPGTVLDAGESWLFRDTVGDLELSLEDATVRGLSVPEGKGALFHSSGESGQVALRRVGIEGLDAHTRVVIGGLVQTVGASVEMSEVRVSEVSVVASEGAWGLLAYIGNGGDLLVQDVQLLGGSVTGDFVGSFYVGSPESLVVEGLEVAELAIAPVYTAYSLGLYYSGQASEMRVEDLTVRDNTLRYSMDAHTQMYGGLGITANHYGETPIAVKRLKVLGNTVQSAGGFTVRGGVVSVGSGTMTVDNALVAGNHFETADGGTLQGLVGEAYYSEVSWTNADIALNSAKGFELVQGGAFIAGSDNRYDFVNVSVVDNDFSDNDQVLASTWYSYYDSEISWAYSNVHGNLPEATPAFYEDFSALELDTLEVDPLYLEPEALDLSLREDSPLIDAGDPAILDADGSTSDIGAFGGPEGW